MPVDLNRGPPKLSKLPPPSASLSSAFPPDHARSHDTGTTQHTNEQEDSSPSADKAQQQGKKVRAIDAFLEELKMKGTLGSSTSTTTSTPTTDESAALMGGSWDVNDPNTTNLYIGNVSPHVTEEVLLREFGRFGPIGSVKIMWPRSQEERERNRNSGFVLFMDRNDADRAKDAMQGLDLMGYQIRIGWGKNIPRPSVPIFTPEKLKSEPSERDGTTASSSTQDVSASEKDETQIRVTPPQDPELLKVIHLMANYVSRDGFSFENAIFDREHKNSLYRFLYDYTLPEHKYYRWKVFSLTQGDTEEKWRTAPFQMFVGGPIWVPPPCPLPIDAKSRAAAMQQQQYPIAKGTEEEQKKGELTDEEFEYLQVILRSLTSSRQAIKNAMGFALDHADAAEEIVHTVSESLMINETPVPVKLARLHLLSDILHNSSAPVKNASQFRTAFQGFLPGIFESINAAIRGLGRISGEAFKDKVLRVLRAWEMWSVFPQQLLDQLQETLVRKQ